MEVADRHVLTIICKGRDPMGAVQQNTVLPDRIYLTLAHSEFPNWEDDLPKDLYHLIMSSNRVILNWIEEGWTPAMHGYNHVFISEFSGMNPVNNRSEFAGIDLVVQKDKISKGIQLLHALEIYPKIFVAPAHTFDKNTLIALKEESDIRIISDTIAKDIYYDDDFYFIPQQSGEVREIKLPTVTFCYHPNNMSEKSFNKLEDFIVKHKNEMISFNDLVMRKRKLDFQDKVLKSAYFMIHSFKKEKR